MKLPRMIRNLWTYRKVIALAPILGFLVAFIFANDDKVQISIPLGPRVENFNAGLLMLISAALGAAVTWMVMTIRFTMQQARANREVTSDTSSGAKAETAAPTSQDVQPTAEPGSATATITATAASESESEKPTGESGNDNLQTD